MSQKMLIVFAMVVVIASVTAESHKDFCPKFGEFNVKHQAFVMGKAFDTTIRVGGCFSKQQVPNGGIGDNRFNLWLGTASTNGSFCNPSNISEKQYFQFSCISSWYPENKAGRKVLFMKLYDRAARHGRLAARCAIYEKINHKYAVMQIALDDHQLCKNNGEKRIDPRFMTSPTKSNWTDEPVVLIMDIQEVHTTDVSHVDSIPVEKVPESTSSVDTLETKDPKPLKKNAEQFFAELMWNKFQMSLTNQKKAVEPATLFTDDSMQLDRTLYQTRYRRAVNDFRFPEWAQGCWTNVCINGGALIFDKNVLSEIEPDETDYQQVTTHKNSKRKKRTPCFDSPTTPKPASTTGPFPVKFKDEDYPLDGFRTNKRELNSDSEVDTLKVKMPLNAVEQIGDYVKKMTDVVVSTISKRAKRNTDNFSKTTKTTWYNVMPIYDDGLGSISKFLIANNISVHNDEKKTDPRQKYWCLWLVLRDQNIIEYTGIPAKIAPKANEDLLDFGQELCTANPHDGQKNYQNVHAQKWITETRNNVSDRVPVSCPVLPGTVFYGKLPPSQILPVAVDASTASAAGSFVEPSPDYCVKLISSVDNVATGQEGHPDRMIYTVSQCIDPASLTGISPQPMNTQVTNDAATRGYTAVRGGTWSRTKRHDGDGAPQETHTVSPTHDHRPPTSSSSVQTTTVFTPTTTSIPIPTSTTPTTSTPTSTTSTPTPALTTNAAPVTAPWSMPVDRLAVTTLAPPTSDSTSTVTSRSTDANATAASTTGTVPVASSHPQRQAVPSAPLPPSASTDTHVTGPFQSHQSGEHRDHQQQWRSRPNNDDDYYNRGRQQYYPPPPPGSTSTDYSHYYRQRQQQQQQQPLPQWPPQPQPQWTPPPQPQWPPQPQPQWQPPATSPSPQQQQQQQSQWYPTPSRREPYSYNNNNNNYGGHQQQTTTGGVRRTDDYYYRQQQKTTTTTPAMVFGAGWRNASSQQPNVVGGGGWNVHGDRPMYVTSAGGGDTSSSSSSSSQLWNRTNGNSNGGGWTTAAQQHWWYQQQQQQQRQQQNNRGGILSLPPVPLPPLRADQTTVAVSTIGPFPPPQPSSSSPPLQPLRPHKPPNHYYQPTPSTNPTTQPNRLRPKSHSRYYQEREYKCLGQWTEDRSISSQDGIKHTTLTYMYVQRLNRPNTIDMPEYECYVVTSIPNQPGQDPRATSLLLAEAGEGTHCSRLADPYVDGMKLVGTKIDSEGAKPAAGKSWFPLKPQQISPANTEGKWYASPPVPVSGQNPTTMSPIVHSRHTGGNGALYKPNQLQTRRPPLSPPTQASIGFRTVRDPTIVGFLLSITVWLL